MKKKVISLLLCLVMALSLIPTVAFADRGDSTKRLGWKYAVISEGAQNGYTIREANTSEDLSNKVTVTIGSTPLEKSNNNAATSPQAISSTSTDDVTISVAEGYYIAYVVLCCNDGKGYHCQTSRGANAFGMAGSRDCSTVTIPVKSICSHIPHGFQDKNNFWLMIMVAEIPNPVYVGYDAGSIGGVAITAAPIVKDSSLNWLENDYICQYSTDNGTPSHTVLPINSAAEAEANSKGYTFDGWKLTYYNAYNDGSFSGQTDAGVGGIKKADDSIALFTHAKLVAQWMQGEPQPTPTGRLTIEKIVEGLTDAQLANKVFSFTVTTPDGNPTTVYLPDANNQNQWSTTLTDLPLGTYTVTEDAASAQVNGYNLTTSYKVGDATTSTGDVNVTENGATVTVTNTYTQIFGDPVYNPATLTIKKVDSEDNTKLLPGAEFTLTKQDDSTADTSWTKTATTDANGICTFSNLTKGTYTLTETKAPEGYEKSSLTWTVAITEDEDIQEDKDDAGNIVGYKKVTTCIVSMDGVDKDNYGVFIIPNTKEPAPYTVTLPIQKIVDKKVGSDNPGETKFTFVATKYDEQTEKTTRYGLETITTNGVGTYDGKLTIKVPADLFRGGNGEIMLQVSEVKGMDSKWSYDETVYPVLIKVQNYQVEYIVNPQIALRATADQEPEPTTLTFTNTYSYKYTPTPRPTTPAKPVTSVKTGDMGVALYAGLAILSMTGSAGVILRRRKNDK